MQVNKEQLDEFKKIYLKNFGIELTNQEALDMAISLLTFTKNVVLPNKNN